jgi:hypothetical protein
VLKHSACIIYLFIYYLYLFSRKHVTAQTALNLVTEYTLTVICNISNGTNIRENKEIVACK